MSSLLRSAVDTKQSPDEPCPACKAHPNTPCEKCASKASGELMRTEEQSCPACSEHPEETCDKCAAKARGELMRSEADGEGPVTPSASIAVLQRASVPGEGLPASIPTAVDQSAAPDPTVLDPDRSSAAEMTNDSMTTAPQVASSEAETINADQPPLIESLGRRVPESRDVGEAMPRPGWTGEGPRPEIIPSAQSGTGPDSEVLGSEDRGTSSATPEIGSAGVPLSAAVQEADEAGRPNERSERSTGVADDSGPTGRDQRQAADAEQAEESVTGLTEQRVGTETPEMDQQAGGPPEALADDGVRLGGASPQGRTSEQNGSGEEQQGESEARTPVESLSDESGLNDEVTREAQSPASSANEETGGAGEQIQALTGSDQDDSSLAGGAATDERSEAALRTNAASSAEVTPSESSGSRVEDQDEGPVGEATTEADPVSPSAESAEAGTDPQRAAAVQQLSAITARKQASQQEVELSEAQVSKQARTPRLVSMQESTGVRARGEPAGLESETDQLQSPSEGAQGADSESHTNSIDQVLKRLVPTPGIEPTESGASPNQAEGTTQADEDCEAEPEAYVGPPQPQQTEPGAANIMVEEAYQEDVAAARQTAADKTEQGRVIAESRKGGLAATKAGRIEEARSESEQKKAQAHAAHEAQRTSAQAEHDANANLAQQQATGEEQGIHLLTSESIRNLTSRAAEGVRTVTERIRSGATDLVEHAKRGAKELLDRGSAAAEEARREAERLRQRGRSLIDRALDRIRSGISNLVSRARRLWNDAVDAGRRLLQRARDAVSDLIQWGRERLTELAEQLATALRTALESLRALLLEIGRRLRDALRALVDALIAGFRAFVEFLHSLIATIILALFTAILQIVEWFMRGLIEVLSWFGNWTKGVRDWLQEKLDDIRGLKARTATIVSDFFTGDLYNCDDDQKAKLTRCAGMAVSMANSAAAKLADAENLDPAVKSAFMRFFKSEAPEHIAQARSVLGAAANGIDANPGGMRCEPSDSTQCGGVHAYTFWAILVPSVSMHFCADFLQRSDQQVAVVILHEATHKFARTNDHAYGSGVLGLDTATALDNADTYEQFAGSA